MIKETYTESLTSNNLLNVNNDSGNMYKTFNEKVYFNKNILDQMDKTYNLEKPFQRENIKIIARKENMLLVSYNLESNENKSFSTPLITLKEVNGKYLVDPDEIINFRLADDKYKKAISEHFNILDNESTFIVKINPKINKYRHSTFAIYEITGEKIILKYACDYNEDNHKIEDLNIEDGKIINKVFEELNINNLDVDKLICDTSNISDNFMNEFVEYKNISNHKGNSLNKYIIIPKYINETYFLLEIDDTFISNNIGDLIIGLEGDFKKVSNLEYEELVNFLEMN